MEDFDKFSNNLLEEAKRFFEKAKAESTINSKDAFLHSSLLLAISSLEAYVNGIADDFKDADSLTLYEKGFLLEKKISLKGYSETTLSDDGMTMAGLKGNEIILFDLNNEVQGTVRIGDPQPVVLPQHVKFELAPDGEFIVVLSSFSHTIYFHNRDGKLLSKEKVEDLKGAEIKFSDDSKYAVVHVPNWGKGKTNGYLLFFNNIFNIFFNFFTFFIKSVNFSV